MFYIFLLQTGDSIYETLTHQSLQFDVYQLMKDKEISTSVDPLKVLLKTMEKQNEELVELSLIVPQTEEIKANIQLLIQRCRQLRVSSRIIM